MKCNKPEKGLLGFFLFFIFFMGPVGAAGPPVDWWGTVTIDGSPVNDSAVVDVHINGSSTISATDIVGTPDSGYYLIHVPCSGGDNVTFRVYGVLVNQTAQDCTGLSNELNLTMNKTANGVACPLNYTGRSGTAHSGCSGGYCVHNVCRSASTYCGDGYCDSGESCSADNSACLSGYACTSGCVATAAAAVTGGVTAVTETKTILSITAGESGTVTFEKEDELGVQVITIKVKNDVSNVKVSVTKETARPAEVAEAPSGTVHSYLTVTVANVANKDIESATIKFKVSKSWISSNGIDKNTITLNRYNNGWEKLPTTIASEDDGYVYFEAVTTGFSVFAITGEKVKEVICTANERRCSENKLQQCNPDGTEWLTIEECQYGCDEAKLVCKAAAPSVCTAGELKCVEKDLYRCSEDGMGWEIAERCEVDCVDGKCVQPAVSNWLWVVLAVIIVAVLLLYYYKKK
jgi:PGF-pre-PGF domain-containing protein